MSEYYSLNEIKQIIDFYNTPVGKKFADKSPEVAQKMSAIMMQPHFVSLMQNVIMKYLK